MGDGARSHTLVNLEHPFLSESTLDSRKLVTVAWHKLCAPVEAGVLDIRSLRSINAATMLKLSWELRASSQPWAILLRARFLRGHRPGAYYVKSSIWLGIRLFLQFAMDGSQWCIGTGSSVNFWLDNWLGSPLSELFHIPVAVHHALKASVADFIVVDT